MTNAIEVQNLKKNFRDVEAVKDISFEVKQGSLFAFLGTNGAGKSTTIDILCTLTNKTAGTVKIAGHTIGSNHANDQIRNEIGVVFQDSILDERLTVYENIWHRGVSYGLKHEELKTNYKFVATHLHLDDIAKKKYGKLSGGQRRRADIARALIHRPSILFLDEPTTGLDPKTRQFVWQAIKQLQEETNMTVFLTTHYMEEAAVADEIVVIKKGTIVAQGTPNELKEQYAYDQLIILFQEDVKGENYLSSYKYKQHQDTFVIPLKTTKDALSILKEVEPVIQSFEVIKGSMDDVFIRINEEGEMVHDNSNELSKQTLESI
ncbi:ATP-binding cassette domain-containing protein [Rummeliibacillus sp. NPDC094406]|uniref:ABC transporter ATP-binding protein n=1 Tax=Rummeliibacillus sp. NPDC094406 TaxID=3364511 RepID=UPI0037FC1BCB